ncbi:ribosome biogenesis GTPase YlqF [Butyrivibrio sp. AE2032]|uniref:ribosome biogenesis GTPase YlqF n=1 Tax=Butyrivibrio sp. AE2032 TaxID=1458463 RepID=UPI0005566E00|nr:ribosome biogenesis GTPase YlqF [Butyrivibrio sp. AE2032]
MAEKKNDINWFPGHMRKALNETGERMKLVDVVYETADARIPFSSRNPELDKIIGNKPRIVILNKADLADPAKTPLWIKSLESENIRACALESTHKKGFDKLNAITMELMKEKLEKAAEKGRTGRPVRVMVVGAPNTGKSTIINALAGRKAAVTGDKPGVTKDFKWIMTGGRLELMDMAGVLWPRIANAKSGICLTALGSVKEEITDVVKVAYETLKIMAGIYPDLLKERYGVDIDVTLEEEEGFYQDPFYDIFLAMAKKRGCIMSGGRIDEERFARLFLNDLREGRTGRITLEMPEDYK